MISFHIRYHFWIVAFVVSMLASPHVYASVSQFDVEEVAYDNLAPFKKWTSALKRTRKQFAVDDSECDKRSFHPCVVIEWKKLVTDLKSDKFMDQLVAVNDWGNAHPYIVDQLNWGMNDYWETPYEFMTVNGDCEDYAIAKYFSLRALGIPAERMRIIIVQDQNLGGVIHAILGVHDDNKLWILDNQSDEVKQAASIYHYKPIYSVNENKWWRYLSRNP